MCVYMYYRCYNFLTLASVFPRIIPSHVDKNNYTNKLAAKIHNQMEIQTHREFIIILLL